MKQHPLLILAVLIIIGGLSLPGMFSCASDETLLEIDSTFVRQLPVENPLNPGMASSDYLANRYLKITSKENRMFFLADSLGLMSLDPVYIPEGPGFVTGNYSFGWPVAAMIDSSIVVSTQRKLVSGQFDDKSGRGQLLFTSHDAGKTWSSPIEVQNIQPYGYTVGSQSCLGSFNGKFIQKGNGTLISDDLGLTWNPYPRAFKFATQEQYGINEPQIHNHPFFGLIFLTGTTSSVEAGSVFRSDDGITWEDSFWSFSGGISCTCPAPSLLVMDDGSILMVSSNGKNMVQYFYQYAAGDTYNDIQFSIDTIFSIKTSASEFDVPDLIFNPVAEKIELLESNTSSLVLWSIGKNDLLNGSTGWVEECILFKRNGIIPMYPGGSVVDPANGIQHIFLYIGGEFPDRNCIYSISRTLDSKKLSAWINDHRLKEGI